MDYDDNDDDEILGIDEEDYVDIETMKEITQKRTVKTIEYDTNTTNQILSIINPWKEINNDDVYWLEFKPLIRFNHMNSELFVNNLSE